MERPLTVDGRDLCAEAFAAITAERTQVAVETPEDIEAIQPATPARPAAEAELSKTARALVKDAQEAGWRARTTYAQAWMPVAVMVEDPSAPLTPTGRIARKKVTQSQLVDSIIVRLGSPQGVRAVVVYEGGKPTEAWLWVEDVEGVVAVNVTIVTAIVKGTWIKPMSDAEAFDLDEFSIWTAA